LPEIVRDGTGRETRRVVLVVDDEELVRKFLKRVLTAEGYEILTANDGMEALALVKAATVDLVITDIRMPVMGGLELGAQISHLPQGPPVLYASASDNPPPGAEGLYLQKPFSLAEMIRLVGEILARGATHREREENVR
jgi:CheY-like chemotaxis protein